MIIMNCLQCLHTHSVHKIGIETGIITETPDGSKADSLMFVGRCLVPGCGCLKYVDKIEKIDEDLL